MDDIETKTDKEKNWRAELIKAVLDFIYEDDPKDSMTATFTMLRTIHRTLSDEEIKQKTLKALSSTGVDSIRNDFKVALPALLESLKNEKGGGFSFVDEIKFRLFDNKWLVAEIDEIDEVFGNIIIKIFTVDIMKRLKNRSNLSMKDIQKAKIDNTDVIGVPRLLLPFFTALSHFPPDSLIQCDECQNYFFDERGYKRRFCSKKCNDRFSVRKSRAKKAMAKKKGGKE